jgi:GGDEF domain-containing protein
LKRLELQERVGQIEFEVRPGKHMALALSAGASVFPHDGTTYEALLAEADHRMYRDKAARRGQGTPRTIPINNEFGIESFDPESPNPATAQSIN